MGSCPRSKTMLSAFRGTVALRRCAATAVLDWGAIASKISTDSGKTELAALRMEMAEVNKALDSVPTGEASVDFAHWRTRIQTPGAGSVRGRIQRIAGPNPGGHLYRGSHHQ